MTIMAISRFRYSAPWREALIAITGTVTAFVLGYVYAVAHPYEGTRWSSAQLLMTPAVNYACTGHFGPLRLAPDATPADIDAVTTIETFFVSNQLDYSCDSFPRHVLATSFFDGIDSANVEQPLYLTVLYAVMWRWLGLHWTLTHYVAAATVALSFITVYLCARGFMPSIVSAALALIFVSSPFFIPFTLQPRDAVKFPFAVAISALLIAGNTAVRTPTRFISYACGVGLLIGIGYGFRSDIYLFLFPAAVIIAFLGQIDLSSSKLAGTRSILANLALRGAAVGALVVSFGIGGWMPLLNDHYFHEHSSDVGYHVMAMGLLGHTRADLFQRDGMDGGRYMYRNAYPNDLSVGVRVIEYAARRYGEVVTFAAGSYWTYSKRYYLDVVSLIPADLLSGAIGAFVNLMTLPNSLKWRQDLAIQYDHLAPWTSTYDFARDTYLYDVFARSLDRTFNAATGEREPRWPLTATFVANLMVFFLFLCLVAQRFGFRSAIATLVLLGAVLAVTSLKFEMRHMFYIYVFPLVAWGAALWLIFRSGVLLLRRRGAAARGNRLLGQWRSAASTIAMIAVLLAAVCNIIVFVLLAARVYQISVLRPLLTDWAERPRIPAETVMSELRPGLTRIRILSPVPLSSGGQRRFDVAFIPPAVDMGVVAVEIDRRHCPGGKIVVTAVGDDSNTQNAIYLSESLSSSGRVMESVVFLPAFNNYVFHWFKIHFAGLDVETQNVPCIKAVSLVTKFKKTDVLFDFVTPKDAKALRKVDLFQEVYIPGIGFL
jgi:hypothetical protein